MNLLKLFYSVFFYSSIEVSLNYAVEVAFSISSIANFCARVAPFLDTVYLPTFMRPTVTALLSDLLRSSRVTSLSLPEIGLTWSDLLGFEREQSKNVIILLKISHITL